jgi:hypothetical protein
MSIRQFMNIIVESYEDEDDEYQAPTPEEYTLKAGTTVYHGTNGRFDERHGLSSPSWVTDSIETAKYFATWKPDEGKARLTTWKINGDLRLAIMTTEYLDYCHEDLCYEDPEDILAHLRREGFDGWIIPDNYGTRQADILLNDANMLDYVKSTRL